jgi:ABC-type proline/glycine betaine transport system substrate-binding protein
MGRMYIVLSDETERKLRLAVVTVLGGKKGDLSAAIEEAVKEWLEKNASDLNTSRWLKQHLSNSKKKR